MKQSLPINASIANDFRSPTVSSAWRYVMDGGCSPVRWGRNLPGPACRWVAAALPDVQAGDQNTSADFSSTNGEASENSVSGKKWTVCSSKSTTPSCRPV